MKYGKYENGPDFAKSRVIAHGLKSIEEIEFPSNMVKYRVRYGSERSETTTHSILETHRD